jgi:hypothetical protein
MYSPKPFMHGEPGNGGGQRGLAVVDVPDGTDD